MPERCLSSPRMNATPSRIAVLVLLFAWGSAACGADEEELVENVEIDGPEDPVELIETLPGVDVSDLEGADRRAWVRLVNEQLSPCGEPISVARCVSESRDSCPKCTTAARYLARLVLEGAEPIEARELYRNRYGAEGLHEFDVEGAPVRGATMGAPVTLVEFSDFECPFCGQAHPLIKRVLRRFEGRVQLVYKHYPLPAHEHAMPAAFAAVAAMRQGKFWEMHDMLFEHQDALEVSDLEVYARELGLDLARFRQDMRAEETSALVMQNRAQGQEAGVRGTPSIYVNGRKFEEPLESLEEYIREELEQS